MVLDFFAGSGTTAQAVLELNEEDGGNRRFIICTNNENGICENVTFQRINTILKGKTKEGHIYPKQIKANLKYYKIDFINKELEDLSDEIMKHIIEMIQLEYGIHFGNRRCILISSDEEMDEFEKNLDDYNDVNAVFIGQDVLTSYTQERLLTKYETFIVPDCYFDNELREVGEIW